MTASRGICPEPTLRSTRSVFSMASAVTPFEAAASLNVVELGQVAKRLSSSEILSAGGDNGITLAHSIAASFTFFKAGEISTLVQWPNANRTVYSQDVRLALGRALRPVLRALLAKAPPLATTADIAGATALHIAARTCADDVVDELLRAGARADALTSGGLRRSPIDEAMMAGCTESLGLLLSALAASDPAAHRVAVASAASYSQLAGAALSPLSLRALLGPEHVRHAAAAGFALSASARAKPTPQPPPIEDLSAATCHEGGGWDVEAPPSQAEREQCEIEQVSGLSAAAYHARFYTTSRPVLIRGALSLSERCAYAKNAKAMATHAQAPLRCGRTAYPSLTGQRTCGTFSLSALNGHPACTDTERTRPVCASKPSGGVNRTAPFFALPVAYRYEDNVAPNPVLSQTWRRGGSRQLFAGGRGSGAALHFHNPAYNVQFFGVKRCESFRFQFATLALTPASLPVAVKAATAALQSVDARTLEYPAPHRADHAASPPRHHRRCHGRAGLASRPESGGRAAARAAAALHTRAGRHATSARSLEPRHRQFRLHDWHRQPLLRRALRKLHARHQLPPLLPARGPQPSPEGAQAQPRPDCARGARPQLLCTRRSHPVA